MPVGISRKGQEASSNYTKDYLLITPTTFQSPLIQEILVFHADNIFPFMLKRLPSLPEVLISLNPPVVHDFQTFQFVFMAVGLLFLEGSLQEIFRSHSIILSFV